MRVRWDESEFSVSKMRVFFFSSYVLRKAFEIQMELASEAYHLLTESILCIEVHGLVEQVKV